ncbi:MAG: SAM-dependent methyltransferase [Pyrinomonadaceae bacterium]
MNQQSANHEATAALAARLRDAIRHRGPVSFRDWMEAALYDERDGYYSRTGLTRWGPSGDYRTSPERSPLFASTFARYFAEVYRQLGAPKYFTIYEAGAGAGHFAHVVLDTLRQQYAPFYRAVRYIIDERSHASRQQLAALLKRSGHQQRVEFMSDNVRGFSVESGIVFSNELLDALPLHRVRMIGGVLCEQFVDVDGAGEFIWADGEPSDPRLAATLVRCGVVLCEGQQAEINLAAEDWLKKIAGMLMNGFVITVDYGAEAPAL